MCVGVGVRVGVRVPVHRFQGMHSVCECTDEGSE